NGVAFASKEPLEKVTCGFEGSPSEEGPRMIRGVASGVTIVNTYIPQGQDPKSEKFQYKINWFKRLRQYFETHFDPASPMLWVGDFNVAPSPLDVYDPDKLFGSVCYHPDEHKALKEVMAWGFVDVYRMQNPDERAYTFWDYRIPNAVKRGIGWRIDHICATQPLAQEAKIAWIDKAPRLLTKPSDHTFIVAEFNIRGL
ncbi:MAG: exodeoxyribonuclease III, partial [Desulfobacterales bacterium]